MNKNMGIKWFFNGVIVFAEEITTTLGDYGVKSI